MTPDSVARPSAVRSCQWGLGFREIGGSSNQLRWQDERGRLMLSSASPFGEKVVDAVGQLALGHVCLSFQLSR